MAHHDNEAHDAPVLEVRAKVDTVYCISTKWREQNLYTSTQAIIVQFKLKINNTYNYYR